MSVEQKLAYAQIADFTEKSQISEAEILLNIKSNIDIKSKIVTNQF